MKKQKKRGQKRDSMNAMDQGFNLVFQSFNRATGVDKGNDGKEGNES
ncbi:hypothetical protein PZE06_10165 [Robertmurraya sp. DFI.2.37]|nr:hypothetical protein [Robertmurraya sp. DFI.2.37]MDF1508553.1 hypothetical protein [Robertmurraya sp. DFI.2.37]